MQTVRTSAHGETHVSCRLGFLPANSSSPYHMLRLNLKPATPFMQGPPQRRAGRAGRSGAKSASAASAEESIGEDAGVRAGEVRRREGAGGQRGLALPSLPARSRGTDDCASLCSPPFSSPQCRIICLSLLSLSLVSCAFSHLGVSLSLSLSSLSSSSVYPGKSKKGVTLGVGVLVPYKSEV